MLVMRLLTNKQVFKALFGEKGLKNMENVKKEGKKYFFPYFFILLKINTNDTHMQNFIQIPQKMNP